MAIRYDYLRDITPLKEDWKIKVRVVRMWNMPGFSLNGEINSIEMVIQDDFVS